MTTMFPLMESRPLMQGTHEVKSCEPATNVIIHTYAGNTRSMRKKFASVRIIFEDAGVLSQTIQGLHHEGRESVMAWKGNAQGISAKADHQHFIVGLVAVLVVAAGLLLGVWTWFFTRQSGVLGRLPVASGFRGLECKGLQGGPGYGAAAGPGHTPGRRVRRQGRGRRGQGR